MRFGSGSIGVARPQSSRLLGVLGWTRGVTGGMGLARIGCRRAGKVIRGNSSFGDDLVLIMHDESTCADSVWIA
jgi:hypothetical protein